MIPRRRIDIGLADFVDMLSGVCANREQTRAVVADFEAAASSLLGGRSVRATASGRDALDLILAGLGLTEGDELVLPAYTLSELVSRLRRHGLRPVAADVDTESFVVTPESVAKAITPRTRAVIALHCFGVPCDVAGIREVAAQHGLPLIEDCAHAFGTYIDGRPAGCFGDAALFSLEVAKQVATFGGGLFAADRADLLRHASTSLDQRRHDPWPATRKAVLKCVEEFGVRSPAYTVVARMMFGDKKAGGFESTYRALHDRVRPDAIAFSGFQARRGLRRLAQLEARNRGLNALWQGIAARLPDALRPQQRSRWGLPSAYNFVARYSGDVRVLRWRAQREGLDLAIHGELLDDVAAHLGQNDCPGAAAIYADAVAIPLHLGIDQSRLDRMGKILERVVQA